MDEVFDDYENEPVILWEIVVETYNQVVKSYIPIKRNRKGSRKMCSNEIIELVKKNTIYGKDILKQKII